MTATLSTTSLLDGMQATPLPRIPTSSSMSQFNTSTTSSFHSISPPTSPILTASNNSSNNNNNNNATSYQQLERDNLFYTNRIKELEETLQQIPTENDILTSHAQQSSSFLITREKTTVKNIHDKLLLMTEELASLKKKKKRISLKEKIMVEIETGRVGTRKDPVPALSKKISATQVDVKFLTQAQDLIKALASQLQVVRTKSMKTEEHFRKQINDKKKTIMNQGLRIRNYEQDAMKNKHNLSIMSQMQGLSHVLDNLGPHNRIDTPAGTLILEPNDNRTMMMTENMDGGIAMTNESGNGNGNNNGGGNGNGGNASKSKLEVSLQHVGGLPPMSDALATEAPHLVAPHTLPNRGLNGDPRDNGRPGSNSSKGRRDQWMYDAKGSFKRATVPEMFQISTGRRDPLTGKVAWKGNGIFNRFDAIELFAGKTRNIYR